LVDGHAANDIGEEHTPEHRRDHRSPENAAVPSASPDRVVDFASVIEAERPHDQGNQNQEKRNVEPGEHGRVPVWECRKHRAAGGDEPDFITVPHGTDGREHDAPASLTIEASSVAA